MATRTRSTGSNGSSGNSGVGFKLYGLIPAARKHDDSSGPRSNSFGRRSGIAGTILATPIAEADSSGTSTPPPPRQTPSENSHEPRSSQIEMRPPIMDTSSKSKVPFKQQLHHETRPSSSHTQRFGRVLRKKNSKESFRFPLEEEHMPKTHVSPKRMAELIANADTALIGAVNGGVSWLWNPTLASPDCEENWKLHVAKKDFVLYRRRDACPSKAHTRHMLVRAKLRSTLQDLAYGIVCDNTADHRTFLAHAYREVFLDGAILQVADRPSHEDPFKFAGIKWVAFQSPVDAVFSVRDALFFEYSKTMFDTDGNPMLCRVYHSINPQDYQGSDHDFDFVRHGLCWIQLFRMVPGTKDVVDFTMKCTMDFTSKTPHWLTNRFISAVQSVVVALAKCADIKYIVKNKLMSDKGWTSSRERSTCSVCLKSLSFLRQRHHCRICTEIMCSSCYLSLSVETNVLPKSLQQSVKKEHLIISNEKFCTRCVVKARQDRGLALTASVLDSPPSPSSYPTPGSNGSPTPSHFDEVSLKEFAAYYESDSEMSEMVPEMRRHSSLLELAEPEEDDIFELSTRSCPYDAPNTTPAFESSLQQMEESIAAQQALIRSICIEGERMMRSQRSRPVNYQLENVDTIERPQITSSHRVLALPSSSTSSSTETAPLSFG